MINLDMTRIQILPKLPDGLETLHLDFNYIKELPALPMTLKYLFIKDTKYDNIKVTIPPLPPSIVYFRCDDPKLDIG